MESLAAVGAFLASIPGFFTTLWGALKNGTFVTAGYIWRGLNDTLADAQKQQQSVASFQDEQRRLRVDPAERERLRQQSGKPPVPGG